MAKYSFRFKDFCFPTLLFNYFSYVFRSMWIQAVILFVAFLLGSVFVNFSFKMTSYLGGAFIYIIISIVSGALYRFFLLKDFFTKYELMPLTGLRARKGKNILIILGAIIVVAIILKLIFAFILGATVSSITHSFGGYKGF